jgi:ATP-binding protein involved in chromosome partitioning
MELNRVKAIQQKDSRHLHIEWTDGKVDNFDVVALRKACPCALCVDERTGAKLLDPKSVSDLVRPEKIESVGRYAMNIRFNDGHRTGIYTFDFLRKLATK